MQKHTRHAMTLLASMALPVLPVCSCSNYATPEQNAAATGGLIGAGAGAAVADDAAEGALLGGALGAGAGYLYGRGQ